MGNTEMGPRHFTDIRTLARAHTYTCTSAIDSEEISPFTIDEYNVQLVNILFTQSNYGQTALVACRVLRVNHAEYTRSPNARLYMYINVLFILRP